MRRNDHAETHRLEESSWPNGVEVARRARSRLGENRYNLLTNNCEHFCEWCVRGEHRSYQVDELIVGYLRAWHRMIAAFPRPLFLRRNSAINCSDCR